MNTKPRRSAARTGCAIALLLCSTSAFAEDAQPPTAPAVAEGARPVSARAVADSAAPRFGNEGQFALSLYEGFNASEGAPNGTQVQADAFVAPHLSIGLSLGGQLFQTSPSGGLQSKGFLLRVGPRIGVDFPLSDYVSFWPQLGVDYTHASQSGETVSANGSLALASTTVDGLGVTLAAPLLIHPTRGFFIGAGPSLYQEFANVSVGSESTTSVELEAVVGGAI